MKGTLTGITIFLAGLALLASSANADPYSGLWTGTATLNQVSEINQREADMSFDMKLVGVKTESELVAPGASWLVDNSGAAPADGWSYSTTFNDAAWTSAAAPVGYTLGYLNLVASGGTAISTGSTTVYFRKEFSLTEQQIGLMNSVKLRVWRDDGVVVYLNGRQILKNNLPTSFVDYDTTALSAITQFTKTYLEVTVPTTALVAGDNLLAAEVHGASGSDADLLFDAGLAGVLARPTETELVGDGATWKYHYSAYGPGAAAEGDPMDSDWNTAVYDDSTWTDGAAQFGFGEGDETTTLATGSTVKPPTAYFRKVFTPAATDFTYIKVLLLQDDGAVVYLNGGEISRANMPDGAVEHDTSPLKALGSVDENIYVVGQADVDTLLSGSNVLAVEVHQHPAETGNPSAAALTRTPATLDLRLLLHVDDAGSVSLLKEVIQMYDEANSRYVLLSDHTLVPNYTGVAVRDDERVGRRLTAIGFDFPGDSLACTGAVAPTGTIACSFTLDADYPTNPFLHRYHPDHDNLNARYETITTPGNEEVYTVDRDITITLGLRYPPDQDQAERTPPPEWGTTLVGGSYTETLSGLHRDDITVSGPLLLQRVSDSAVLNP
ncbi:MAG: hypothetical protein ACLFOY_15105 [Desulfatibacillaceae bacterium]